MKEKIIKQMTEVVRDIMTSFQSDFYKYDMEILDGYDGKFLWFVAPSHTHIAKIDEHYMHDELCKPYGERFVYALLQNNTTADCCTAIDTDKELAFYYDGEQMVQVFHVEAHRIWKAIKDYTLFEWRMMTGKQLPETMNIPIKFICSLSYVKEQLRFNKEIGGNLIEQLRHFRNYMKLNSTHVIEIGRDFADHSFNFASVYYEDGEKKCSINGGLIYYDGKWNTHT